MLSRVLLRAHTAISPRIASLTVRHRSTAQLAAAAAEKAPVVIDFEGRPADQPPIIFMLPVGPERETFYAFACETFGPHNVQREWEVEEFASAQAAKAEVLSWEFATNPQVTPCSAPNLVAAQSTPTMHRVYYEASAESSLLVEAASESEAIEMFEEAATGHAAGLSLKHANGDDSDDTLQLRELVGHTLADPLVEISRVEALHETRDLGDEWVLSHNCRSL